MSIDSRKKGYLLVLALTMALLPCFNALRTNAATRGQEGAKAQEKTMTITGCLPQVRRPMFISSLTRPEQKLS